MNWPVGIGLSLVALEVCAILYLCLPTGRKRTSGPWLIAGAALGAFLGAVILAPPDVSGKRWLAPFDPNDEVASAFLGGEWTLPANFFLGAGIPFLALAIRALVQGEVKKPD